jgi:hypothetical protein
VDGRPEVCRLQLGGDTDQDVVPPIGGGELPDGEVLDIAVPLPTTAQTCPYSSPWAHCSGSMTFNWPSAFPEKGRGIRHSHQEARAAQTLAISANSGLNLVLYHDVDLLCLTTGSDDLTQT